MNKGGESARGSARLFYTRVVRWGELHVKKRYTPLVCEECLRIIRFSFPIITVLGGPPESCEEILMSALKKKWLKTMEQGKKRFERGRPEHAVKAFSIATQLAPNRVEGWVNLGSALVESGQYEKAIETLHEALSIDPRQMVAYMMLGDALRQSGRMPEALKHYTKAVSMQRSPVALNRLACAQRAVAKREEAEQLLEEVLAQHSQFNLARINLANVQIERGKIDSAEKHLRALTGLRLSGEELAETKSIKLAVSQYRYMADALQSLEEPSSLVALESTLREQPQEFLDVDGEFCAEVEKYADSANALCDFEHIDPVEMDARWPLLEAGFQNGTLADMSGITQWLEKTDEFGAVGKIEQCIAAAASAQQALEDEIGAEIQLRRWHAIAFTGAWEFMPGHFKYTKNLVAQNPGQHLVGPASTIGTFRHVMREIYPRVKPGLPRAIFIWMALCRIHPFVDGNGRIGRVWLNRELQWAGEMPALFPANSDLKAALERTMQEVYAKGDGDVSPMLPVFIDGQRCASECSRESLVLAG
ncbi:MAG: Flp pilus assembly protein TadD [Halioglobus sp.]